MNRSIPRADLTLRTGDWIKASAPSGLRAPHVDVREDGGALLTWDLGEHHLDVEINTDTTLDFFYLNRQTAEAWNVESTEENPIPRSVRAVLDYFITPATATDNAPPRP